MKLSLKSLDKPYFVLVYSWIQITNILDIFAFYLHEQDWFIMVLFIYFWPFDI